MKKQDTTLQDVMSGLDVEYGHVTLLAGNPQGMAKRQVYDAVSAFVDLQFSKGVRIGTFIVIAEIESRYAEFIKSMAEKFNVSVIVIAEPKLLESYPVHSILKVGHIGDKFKAWAISNGLQIF